MRSRSNYDIKMGVKSNMRAKMRLYISRELINDFATKREGHNSDDFHNFYRRVPIVAGNWHAHPKAGRKKT